MAKILPKYSAATIIFDDEDINQRVSKQRLAERARSLRRRGVSMRVACSMMVYQRVTKLTAVRLLSVRHDDD